MIWLQAKSGIQTAKAIITRQVYSLFQEPVEQEVEFFYKGKSEFS